MASKEKVGQDDESQGIRFIALKDFALFILEHKLYEVTRLNLEMTRELKLPLLSHHKHLSEEDLFSLFLKDQREFFQQIMEGTALHKAKESLFNQKKDKPEGIRREQLQVIDQVVVYSMRKQVAYKVLPEYSTDCSTLIAVIQDFESFHVELERMASELHIENKQEELHSKNHFLSSLIENSVNGIVAIDKDLKVTEWNPALEETFKILKKDIIGKPLPEFFPALYNSPIFAAFRQALEGKPVHLREAKYSAREGYYEANVAPLYNEEEEISGAFGVIHDITYRKQTEDRLKEHREELQAANEELREQREELQAANEELTEQQEEIKVVNEELQDSLTKLEEAQEALERTVNQLEEAQEIAKVGSFEFYPERDLVVWSAEMKRIFGFESSEKVSLNYAAYLSMVYPEDREMIKNSVARSVEENTRYSFEHRIINKNGDLRWLLAHGRPLYVNGKLLKLQGTALDITERKLAALKLEEEQYFIKKVTDTTPDIITVFDLEKKVNVYANRELTSILGYSEDEIENLRKEPTFLQKLVHPEDLERGLKIVMGFRNHTDNLAREVEYRLRTKSGEYLWVAARYNVFRRDAQGVPVQLIGITRNIHDRRLAEEEIRKANIQLQVTNKELVRTQELLKEANNDLEEQVERRTAELQRKNAQLIRINADLDNFIYTASHDLKVPIVNLEGLLILVNKKIQEKLPEKEQNLLKMMHTSIERFKKTIEDLSDVTKMQKELDDQVNEIIELSPLLQDIENDIEQLIQDNQARISSSFEVEKIAFDRKNMRSILYNFLTNAIKYRSPERSPEVYVKTYKTKNGVVLSISDNGEGIPENQYEKIFSLFKRLNKNVEGSGMGLYIVKRIVDNYGGSIEVKSEPGKGTTFNIYLQDGKKINNHIIG